MTTKATLLPCPFDGRQAQFVRHGVGIPGTMGHDSWWGISCAVCNAGIGFSDNRFRSKDDAIKAWNMRAA